MRGMKLTLNADGTGTAQVETPSGESPASAIESPWWAYHAAKFTWVGPNHWTLTNFPGQEPITIDCTR